MSHTSSTHNHKSSFFVLCARPAFIRRGWRQFSTQPFHSKLGGEVSDTKRAAQLSIRVVHEKCKNDDHTNAQWTFIFILFFLFSFLSAFDWFTISKSYNIKLPVRIVSIGTAQRIYRQDQDAKDDENINYISIADSDRLRSVARVANYTESLPPGAIF